MSGRGLQLDTALRFAAAAALVSPLFLPWWEVGVVVAGSALAGVVLARLLEWRSSRYR